MSRALLVGIDLGTTKLCAVALDAARGAVVAVEGAATPGFLPGDPDSAEQDATAILAVAERLLAALVARPEVRAGEVLGLGVTGQMHGVVLLDVAGAPCSPLISWQDRRGLRNDARSGRTYVDEVIARLGDAAGDTGCRPATGYGGVTLFRLQREGLLPPAGRAVTIHDALVAALCGAAVIDPTDAAGWGLCDVADGGRWLPALADALPGIASLLPEMRPTGGLAGGLRPAVAARVGLPAGLPIAVALGDNQASFFGSVPSPTETMLCNLGTGGQCSTPIDRYVRLESLETRPLRPGHWLLVGASLCGGRAYQLLADFFAHVGRDLFHTEAPALYDAMSALAATADETCGGVRASTLFAGARLDPAARAAVTGLDAANFTPANLIRAVMQGMVGELAAFAGHARAAGAHPTRLAGAGNAVRRNPVVRAELARHFGLPVHLPPHPEEAAVGAALSAGVAAGVFPDWEAAGAALFRAAHEEGI